MTESARNLCNAPLHPQAAEGLRLFNAGQYFEAHEALEAAWNEEKSEVRDLYRGILQIAVVYLHIRRGNYPGAIKVYGRSLKWMKDWPEVCRGIQVGKLRRDAEIVLKRWKDWAQNILQNWIRRCSSPSNGRNTNRKKSTFMSVTAAGMRCSRRTVK